MIATNRNNVDRLTLPVRMTVADSLLDGMSYAEVRERLAADGMPEDFLPSDRSLRAYQNGSEYQDWRDRAVEEERALRAREAVAGWPGADGLGVGAPTDLASAARTASEREWQRLAGALSTEAAWREASVGLAIDTRAQVLARLDRSLTRSDALLQRVDAAMLRADRAEHRRLDYLDLADADAEEEAAEVLDDLDRELCDYLCRREGATGHDGNCDADADLATAGGAGRTTGALGASQIYGDFATPSRRDGASTCDDPATMPDWRSLADRRSPEAVKAAFEKREMQLDRERRQRLLEQQTRQAISYGRERDRWLRHPSVLRANMTLRMTMLFLKLMDDQVAAVAAARKAGLPLTHAAPVAVPVVAPVVPPVRGPVVAPASVVAPAVVPTPTDSRGSLRIVTEAVAPANSTASPSPVAGHPMPAAGAGTGAGAAPAVSVVPISADPRASSRMVTAPDASANSSVHASPLPTRSEAQRPPISPR